MLGVQGADWSLRCSSGGLFVSLPSDAYKSITGIATIENQKLSMMEAKFDLFASDGRKQSYLL